MKRLAYLFAAGLVFLSVQLSHAKDTEDERSGAADKKAAADVKKSDVNAAQDDDLKARVERLEKIIKDGEVTDELGHRLHPTHSIYGLRIRGGLTATAQGTTHLKAGKSRGAYAMSGDLAVESPVGENGRAAMVLDFQRGAGARNLPPLFTSPNDNPTGINNDLESFNNDQLHVTQLYYEHSFDKSFFFTIGQLDPTSYFDTNNYSNNERSQLLANVFVNNPAIEFGGTPDFYGPGFRATYYPTQKLNFTVGAIDGDGDYVDTFDRPFLMAEADFKADIGGKEGNYRFYYWNRHGRPSIANAANPNDQGLRRASNQGAGISFDQKLADSLGVWLRAGVQRETVAQFGKSVSGGVNVNGLLGRENDILGLGYAATFIGKNYRDFKRANDRSFQGGTEHYFEAYYNIAVDGATDITGFHVSPDIQYIVNPGGDRNGGDFFVYGARLQAFF